MVFSNIFLFFTLFASGDSDIILHLQDIKDSPGREILQPVLVSLPCPVLGFQTVISYPENTFENDIDISIEGTALSVLNPELIITNYLTQDGMKALFVAVHIDYKQPFDGRTLSFPANSNQEYPLFYLKYISPEDSKKKIPLTFSNNFSTPPYNNVFTGKNFTSLPAQLIHGSFEVKSTASEKTFLRGDVNGDRTINVADTVYLLTYLFAQGFDPYPCIDTGDLNDTGQVDIADCIYILSYLFADGSPPVYPFPQSGIDPTEDSYLCE